MKTRWLHPIVPLLILLLAFGLRLYRLDSQSIWWDEGHSIFVAEHPLAQIPTIPAMDVHPPAYFALLHGWMAVAGRSEFALRYLSVGGSLLTVALLWRFAADVAARRAAAPTALLAALSPLYVAYAQEVRSYALFTLVTLAATFALWHIIRAGHTSRRWLALYAVLAAVSLYVHYFTIFLLVFHTLVWAGWIIRAPRLERRWRFTRWVVVQAGIGLLFVPQLWLAVRQITSYTNPNLMPPSPGVFIRQSWQAYTVGLTIDPAPARWGMVAVAVALLAGAGRLWRSRYRGDIVFLAGWFVIPLLVYFAVLQRQPSFEPRYMIPVTPALFLGLGLSAAVTSVRWRQIIGPVLLMTLSAAALIVGLHSYYTNSTYFKDDSAGVARWLAAETTANDIVYIDVPHPFHYYADRLGFAAPTRYLFVDIHTAADTLTTEAVGRDRLFWITWRGSDTDPRGVIPFLAEKYGQQLGQRDFRGYRAVWFGLPPTLTAFDLPTNPPPTQAIFGDALQLDGAAFGEPQILAGDAAWVTLHFSLLRPVAVDYRVSVRLRAEDGRQVAQVDKDLLNDRHFRTAAWPINDPALNQALNVYTLPVAPDVPPGIYRLEVVVYNAQPPYPSEGVSGSAAAPDGLSAWLGQITVR